MVIVRVWRWVWFVYRWMVSGVKRGWGDTGHVRLPRPGRAEPDLKHLAGGLTRRWMMVFRPRYRAGHVTSALLQVTSDTDLYRCSRCQI